MCPEHVQKAFKTCALPKPCWGLCKIAREWAKFINICTFLKAFWGLCYGDWKMCNIRSSWKNYMHVFSEAR